MDYLRFHYAMGAGHTARMPVKSRQFILQNNNASKKNLALQKKINSFWFFIKKNGTFAFIFDSG
jgi:hypothetical protein